MGKFTIAQHSIRHCVFSYTFENRLVFIGSSVLDDVRHFGKHCQTLDVEFQRRMGTPDDELYFGLPTVSVEIFEMDLDERAAADQAAHMATALCPVWQKPFNPDLARRLPHILHVESKHVFPTAHAASTALNIGSTHAYNILNRPMFLPHKGRGAIAHLVTTSRPVTLKPWDKRYGNLNEWRIQNGLGEFNR